MPLGVHAAAGGGVVDAAVIDRDLSFFEFGIDFDEAFAKAHVTPRIVLLRLDGGGDDGFDAHD